MRNSREAEEQSAELAKLGSAEQSIRGRKRTGAPSVQPRQRQAGVDRGQPGLELGDVAVQLRDLRIVGGRVTASQPLARGDEFIAVSAGTVDHAQEPAGVAADASRL